MTDVAYLISILAYHGRMTVRGFCAYCGTHTPCEVVRWAREDLAAAVVMQ